MRSAASGAPALGATLVRGDPFGLGTALAIVVGEAFELG